MSNYESVYPGSYSSLDPEFGEVYTGYRIPASQLGATTSVQTANQIREVTNLLNQGIKNIEVSTISADVFESIPDIHLEDINRLAKLTGSDVSLHAPILEPSGFTQQGWDEANRQMAEKQFKEIIERAHKLNPQGNIPVTIHASAVPGTEWIPVKNKETGKIEQIPQRLIAVNQETGETTGLVREERFYPDRIKKEGEQWKGTFYEADKELEIANASYWDNKLSQLVFYKERGDELLQRYYPLFAGEKQADLTPEQKNAMGNVLGNAMIYLNNTHQNVNSLFNQAFKFADEGAKEKLRKAADEFQKEFAKAQEKGPGQVGYKINPAYYSQALQTIINSMKEITDENAPNIYVPMEKFVKDNASKTLSNVAFNAFDKFGKTAPIVSIENPPYGSAIARAEDLKDLIEITRQKFIEKAKKEGYSESEAEVVSKKLIGATWDTSHISMMRKQGFTGKDLVEQAKTIAPFVKHVHFNDNMGSTHTDLPPGMGSVPIKEIMTEFEKAGIGKETKKVFEGGGFFQHFQRSPHPYLLEAVGSPIYGMAMAPFWNQIQDIQGSYFSGIGTVLPEQHFSLYGTGFSSLPTDLGGQISGRGNRMTGTPME